MSSVFLAAGIHLDSLNVEAAIFSDASEAWGDNVNGFQPLGILKDIGTGFGMGNTRLGLGRVIHFDFAFPLDGNGAVDDFQFLIQTENFRGAA